MSATELILWGIGILVSIIAGFWATKKIKNSPSQRQKVDSGSIGIQAGRDANINDGKQAKPRSVR